MNLELIVLKNTRSDEETNISEDNNQPYIYKNDDIKLNRQLNIHLLIIIVYYICIWWLNQYLFLLLPIILIIITINLRNIIRIRPIRLYRYYFIMSVIINIVNIIYLIIYRQNILITNLFLSANFIILQQIQSIIEQCTKIFGTIKNLLTMMLFLYLICTYMSTFYFGKLNNQEQKYFSDFGQSFFILLQIQTLDGWSLMGRKITGIDEFPVGPIMFCIFIFLLTYFYMNIMIGIIIDTIQPQRKIIQSKFQDYHQMHEKILQEIIQPSLIDEILIGRYYQLIVYVISFGIIIFDIVTDFNYPDDKSFTYFLGYIGDGIYTIHLIILLFKQEKIYQIQRKSLTLMTLHILAGPVSLTVSLLNYDVGSILNLIKLTTTPSIKGIIRGTFKILPQLLPQIIELFGIFMFFGMLCNYLYDDRIIGPHNQYYFNSFWASVYTMIQIMTLDDWCYGIVKSFRQKNIFLPQVLIPVFIFLTNFIVLNTIIALSCEFFTEVFDYNIERDYRKYNYKKLISFSQFKNFIQEEQSKKFYNNNIDLFPKLCVNINEKKKDLSYNEIILLNILNQYQTTSKNIYLIYYCSTKKSNNIKLVGTKVMGKVLFIEKR